MISQLQNQTVTLYSKSSLDRYGREAFGATRTYKVRIQEVSKSKFLGNGQVVPVLAIAYFAPEVTINVDDRVDYGSNNYKVFGKNVAYGADGTAHHIKVELIKWQM
ncbi:MAG TPA: hypothetical protein VD999_05775 [Vitreimonas sp.]|nr:hypothetical protein [Vitreimonas sp.]